jgi:hypothetical protein
VELVAVVVAGTLDDDETSRWGVTTAAVYRAEFTQL